MAKLYWTKEMKTLFDQKIHDLMDKAIEDPEAGVSSLGAIRTCRMFADDIIRDMEELDRQEEEARRRVE